MLFIGAELNYEVEHQQFEIQQPVVLDLWGTVAPRWPTTWQLWARESLQRGRKGCPVEGATVGNREDSRIGSPSDFWHSRYQRPLFGLEPKERQGAPALGH